MGKLAAFAHKQRDFGTSAPCHGKERRICRHGHYSATDETRYALAGTYGIAGILLSGRTDTCMEQLALSGRFSCAEPKPLAVLYHYRDTRRSSCGRSGRIALCLDGASAGCKV